MIGLGQHPVRKIGAKYICNGFSAVENFKDSVVQLTVYECGAWFEKIKITSKGPDSGQIEALGEKISYKYDPTKLTELKPLNKTSDFLVAPALGKDRVRAKYIIKSGLKKLDWANKNVAENEKASGFPDLYLDMHIAAYKEFAESKENNARPDNDIAQMISDINKAINANYLPEFIMKQYNMIMIVLGNMKFDFDGFDKWQEENKVSMHLENYYYVLVYRQPK